MNSHSFIWKRKDVSLGKKKVEHVVFDGMRTIRKSVNIKAFNMQTKKGNNPEASSAKEAFAGRKAQGATGNDAGHR